MTALDAWLARTRLVVCVGSGGVGKTTSAATIGLRGALAGRKAMVLTIDPAKRLANSLGLDQMGGEPTRIDLGDRAAEGGELWAMMLDSKGTFDELIGRIAPDDETRDRILANHVYRHMADAFAGSQDYMATEKLYDLSTDGHWDLLVLDTPPVKNALDFLESPGRVAQFLDEGVIGWFLEPPKKGLFGVNLLAGTSAFFYRLLGYVFGEVFLHDFAEFVQAMRDLYVGFRERHEAVLALLRSDDTQFVTVCAPTPSSIDVAQFFQRELAARALPRAGVVVNQVHRIDAADDDAEAALGGALSSVGADLSEVAVRALLARLRRAHERLRDLVDAERVRIEAVRESTGGVGFFQRVPRLPGEVHDLDALIEVGRWMFGEHASPGGDD